MFKPVYAISLLSLIFALLSVQASAQNSGPDISKLSAALGGAEPDSVSESIIPGLYEVVLGAQIIYLSEDGRFVVQGQIVDLVTSSNVTEKKLSELRLSAIEALGEEHMVIFAPEQPAKHTVSIFTDVDCGYCRKLHGEMSSYLEQGIRIRYLAFPRAGINSESYDKAVSAWCSEDPQDAITRLKLGETIEQKTCDNPVADEYNLGIQLGVQGTPSIITETGEMIPGYVPAERLVQMLKK